MPEPVGPVPKQGLRGLARAFWVLLASAFHADPGRASLNLALSVVDPIATVFASLAVRTLVNGAVAHDGATVTRAALTIGVAAIAGIGAGWGGFNLNMVLREKVGELMDRRIMSLTLAVPSLEHHERADYLDEIEILRTQRDQLSSSVQAVVMNIGMLCRVAGVVGVLATLHPLLALLPLFGIPSLLTAATAERRRQRALERCAEPLRVTRHLLETATTAGPAKEIRLFGLGPTLRSRHAELWRESDLVQDHTARVSGAFSALGWAVFGIGFVGAIALIAHRAIGGHANLGDVFLALTLAAQVNELVSGVAQMVTWLFSGLRTTGRYLWLVDYSAAATAPVANETPPPDRLVDGIEFDHG